jgi:hypothetical protein
MEAWLDDEALVSGLTFRHPPVPERTLGVLEVGLSRGDGVWTPAGGARVVPAWAWAGRTLFAVADGTTEVVFGPARARAVRVTVAATGPSGLAVLCVRGTRDG